MHGGWGVQAHWAVTVIFATLCMNNVLCSVDMNFCLENNAMQCCVQCHMIYIFIYIYMLCAVSYDLHIYIYMLCAVSYDLHIYIYIYAVCSVI